MATRHIKVYPDKDSLVAGTAEWILSACAEAIASRGSLQHCAFGRIDSALALSPAGQRHWRKRFDWSRIEIFQVDERAVPLDHPDNNFGMIERELLARYQIPEDNVHRVHTELGAQAAAEEYEAQLRKSFPATGIPRFDVLLLGHGRRRTHRLFVPRHRGPARNPPPGARLHGRKARTRPESRSLSRSSTTLARYCFSSPAQNKAATLREVLQGESPELRYPAAMVDPENGLLYWHLDTEAASLIHVAVSE